MCVVSFTLVKGEIKEARESVSIASDRTYRVAIAFASSKVMRTGCSLRNEAADAAAEKSTNEVDEFSKQLSAEPKVHQDQV